MESFCLMLLLLCGCRLSLPAFSMEGVGGERELLASPARSRRNAESENSTASSLNVFFTVLHVSGACPGGSTAGLGDTTLRLEFRSNASNFQWVEAASGIPTDVGLYSIIVSAGCGGCVEFRLVQEEHGGGDCNCWNISGNVLVNGSVRAVNVTQGRTVPIGGVQGGRLV